MKGRKRKQQKRQRQCRTLEEYMKYVDRVRKYAASMPMEQAVDRAVDECINEGILKDFLLANKAEVKRMSIYEYDEEATRQAIRVEEYERGRADGIEQGIEALILDNIENGFVKGEITVKLVKRFGISEEKAEAYYTEVLKNSVSNGRQCSSIPPVQDGEE